MPAAPHWPQESCQMLLQFCAAGRTVYLLQILLKDHFKSHFSIFLPMDSVCSLFLWAENWNQRIDHPISQTHLQDIPPGMTCNLTSCLVCPLSNDFFPQTEQFGVLSLGSSWGLCGNEKYLLISAEIGTGLYVRENKFPLEESFLGEQSFMLFLPRSSLIMWEAFKSEITACLPCNTFSS